MAAHNEYRGPNAIRNAIDSAKFSSRSHRAVIRVYDDAGNVIETHEHAGDFKKWYRLKTVRPKIDATMAIAGCDY